ncbi:methylmalonyl-CoA mutase family protein [bacterium]|nr:methylmalonyl-CoA mutase family protein [bacterium]
MFVQKIFQVCLIDLLMSKYQNVKIKLLTHDIAHKAWQHIQEIEDLGGMAKAIETAQKCF